MAPLCVGNSTQRNIIANYVLKKVHLTVVGHVCARETHFSIFFFFVFCFNSGLGRAEGSKGVLHSLIQYYPLQLDVGGEAQNLFGQIFPYFQKEKTSNAKSLR